MLLYRFAHLPIQLGPYSVRAVSTIVAKVRIMCDFPTVFLMQVSDPLPSLIYGLHMGSAVRTLDVNRKSSHEQNEGNF